jgi:hypothetical protein
VERIVGFVQIFYNGGELADSCRLLPNLPCLKN